jgi:hypothetical protein
VDPVEERQVDFYSVGKRGEREEYGEQHQPQDVVDPVEERQVDFVTMSDSGERERRLRGTASTRMWWTRWRRDR